METHNNLLPVSKTGANRLPSCCKGPSVAAEGGPQFTRFDGGYEMVNTRRKQPYKSSNVDASDAGAG